TTMDGARERRPDPGVVPEPLLLLLLLFILDSEAAREGSPPSSAASLRPCETKLRRNTSRFASHTDGASAASAHRSKSATSAAMAKNPPSLRSGGFRNCASAFSKPVRCDASLEHSVQAI